MASILFSVQPGNGQLVYRQIVEQVKAAMASGRLRSGDRLPTHRDLARDLVVAPLTVKKAYDLLQNEGHIVMLQGRGTFVSDRPSSASRPAREDLEARASALVRQARLLRMSRDEVKRLIDRIWSK